MHFTKLPSLLVGEIAWQFLGEGAEHRRQDQLFTGEPVKEAITGENPHLRSYVDTPPACDPDIAHDRCPLHLAHLPGQGLRIQGVSLAETNQALGKRMILYGALVLAAGILFIAAAILALDYSGAGLVVLPVIGVLMIFWGVVKSRWGR